MFTLIPSLRKVSIKDFGVHCLLCKEKKLVVYLYPLSATYNLIKINQGPDMIPVPV
jgi:hypothetical protein